MKTILTKRVLFASLTIIAIIWYSGLLFRGCSSSPDPAPTQIQQNQVERTRDDAGREVARLQAMVTNRDQLLASKDTELQQLRNLVNKSGKHTMSATIAKLATSGTVTIATVISDSSAHGQTDSCADKKPVYLAKYSDNWLSADITSGPDSTSLRYLVTNKFAITQEDERPGWLKARQPVVYIRNLNPNTTTEEMQSWVVKQKSPGRFWYFIGGVAAGSAATTYGIYRLQR